MSDPPKFPLLSSDTFEEDFHDFIYQRCERIWREQIRQNPEYQNYLHEFTQTIQEIFDILKDAPVEIRTRLETASFTGSNIAAHIIYMQGLRDGFHLNRAMEGD